MRSIPGTGHSPKGDPAQGGGRRRPAGAAAEAASPRAIHALVVGDGDVPGCGDLDEAWPGWRDGIALVVAADGGWAKAIDLGFVPDLLVGDADSLPDEIFAEVAARGIAVERSAVAKDESDTELAVLAALGRGASRITMLGALGGPRLDHTVANLGLLALPARDGAAIELLDGRTRVRLLRAGPEPASLALPGRTGELVSLLPLGVAAEGVTTRGLAYPLQDETLPPGPARGLSNVRSSPDASVSLRSGQLLVVETALPGAAP